MEVWLQLLVLDVELVHPEAAGSLGSLMYWSSL